MRVKQRFVVCVPNILKQLKGVAHFNYLFQQLPNKTKLFLFHFKNYQAFDDALEDGCLLEFLRLK